MGAPARHKPSLFSLANRSASAITPVFLAYRYQKHWSRCVASSALVFGVWFMHGVRMRFRALVIVVCCLRAPVGLPRREPRQQPHPLPQEGQRPAHIRQHPEIPSIRPVAIARPLRATADMALEGSRTGRAPRPPTSTLWWPVPPPFKIAEVEGLSEFEIRRRFWRKRD